MATQTVCVGGAHDRSFQQSVVTVNSHQGIYYKGDELAVMDGNKCILQLRGVRPFYSDKFDITKHKRYKQLSDYDKKNEFHVEEYMKHQMEVRLDPEEQFDLYMYEGSELEEQSNNENEGTGHVT
jgi:type IV secretion system protein VirD4